LFSLDVELSKDPTNPTKRPENNQYTSEISIIAGNSISCQLPQQIASQVDCSPCRFSSMVDAEPFQNEFRISRETQAIK